MSHRHFRLIALVLCALPGAALACPEAPELNPARSPFQGYLEKEDCLIKAFVATWSLSNGYADPYMVRVDAAHAIQVTVKSKGKLTPCLTDGSNSCHQSIAISRPGRQQFYVTAPANLEGSYTLEMSVQVVAPKFTCMRFQETIGCQITEGAVPPGTAFSFRFRPEGGAAERGIGRPVAVPSSPAGQNAIHAGVAYTIREALQAGRYTAQMLVEGSPVGAPMSFDVAASSLPRAASRQAPLRCEAGPPPDRSTAQALICAVAPGFDIGSGAIGFRVSFQPYGTSTTIPIELIPLDLNSPRAKQTLLERMSLGTYWVDLMVDNSSRGKVFVDSGLH